MANVPVTTTTTSTSSQGYSQAGSQVAKESLVNTSGFDGITYGGDTINGKAPSGSTLQNGQQMRQFYWLKKAILETQKKMVFSQMASTIGMPKHFGKEIRCYVRVAVLDDKNQNSQGIDATGKAYANGNLYGSSRDIGTILDKLPLVGEAGGRVNRIGFTRLSRKGSMVKMGYFYDFTKESLDFDTEDDLLEQLSRLSMNFAAELQEDYLQADLICAAETVVETEGTSGSEAIADPEHAVTYKDLKTLVRTLKELRVPTQTKVITGSRMIDTKTVGGGYIAFTTPEVVAMLEDLKDNLDRPCWIPVQKYGNATHLLNGEVGAIDGCGLRIVEVQDMAFFEGEGAEATAGADSKYAVHTKGGKVKFDVHPLLVIGEDAFTTIGFQSSGSHGKFNIITKMPGAQTADRTDPFGETGFTSVKWWYGFLAKQPERLGLLKTLVVA